jgi:hypothetical protein
MDIKNTINDLIQLPRRFKEIGKISVYTLLKNSGYFEEFESISEEAIARELTDCPDCLKNWKQFSDDKRSDGWYLKYNGGKYGVGYRSPSGGGIDFEQYPSEVMACAAFIKKEMDEIRLREFMNNARKP